MKIIASHINIIISSILILDNSVNTNSKVNINIAIAIHPQMYFIQNRFFISLFLRLSSPPTQMLDRGLLGKCQPAPGAASANTSAFIHY